jgi:hypothetical protein
MKPRESRLPFLILGVMTVLLFGGPLTFALVLRGGASPNWPPDRPIEWTCLIGLLGMVVVLMALSIPLALANHREMNQRKAALELKRAEEES